MDEQTVRDAIRAQIKRKEERIKKLYSERSGVNKDEKPAQYHFLTENMARLDHSIMTLIELEHMLHLCDCPDEAYQNREIKGMLLENKDIIAGNWTPSVHLEHLDYL